LLLVLDTLGNMVDELLSACNPWPDRRFLKVDKIHIVAFLASFEKIIVNLRQLLRNFSCSDVMSIEEATYPHRFGRGESLLDEKR
jgi:hypothetical protein